MRRKNAGTNMSSPVSLFVNTTNIFDDLGENHVLSLRNLNRLYYIMIVILSTTVVIMTLVPFGSSQDIGHAQETTTPHIVRFEADLESVTPDEAESGETKAVLTWETSGMTSDHHLSLETYVLGEWQYAIEVTETLNPSSSIEVVVPHTLSFQEPTWRLSILQEDNDSNPLDFKELRLPYTIDEETVPEITLFEAELDRVDINDLSQRIVRVPITWEVVNRVPNSNLQFVQLYNNGDTVGDVNVELPREFEWIRSKGEGMVAPLLPFNTTIYSGFILQLQVVDQDDPSIVYATEDVWIFVDGQLPQQPIPTVGSLNITRTPNPATIPAPETCDRDFFFEETNQTYVFSGGGDLNSQTFNLCPTGEIETTQAVFQMYENGIMIWKYTPARSGVFILTNDGLGVSIPSFYTGDDVVIEETPPSGITIIPSGVLGEAWARRRDLSQAVGWPIDEPQSYDMTLQETVGGEIQGVVMSLPSGGRFFLRYGITGQRPINCAWINATN